MQAGVPSREWHGPRTEVGTQGRSLAGLGAPLQGYDGGMCEGPSRISGPIPPDPTLCPAYYRRPASGELGGVAAQEGPSC